MTKGRKTKGWKVEKVCGKSVKLTRYRTITDGSCGSNPAFVWCPVPEFVLSNCNWSAVVPCCSEHMPAPCNQHQPRFLLLFVSNARHSCARFLTQFTSDPLIIDRFVVSISCLLTFKTQIVHSTDCVQQLQFSNHGCCSKKEKLWNCIINLSIDGVRGYYAPNDRIMIRRIEHKEYPVIVDTRLTRPVMLCAQALSRDYYREITRTLVIIKYYPKRTLCGHFLGHQLLWAPISGPFIPG